MIDFLKEAESLFDYTQSMRRDFHMHPELGFQEVRTAGIVSKELQALGLEVATGIGQTGVVAMIEGAKPGPVLMLRADMDALPITEDTNTEYASQNPGVMHACGHDGHTAILLTVAKMLNKVKDELPGSIKLVFQPAEEGMGGAEGMIKDGVMDGPKVDYVLGLHLWNDKPVGWLGIAEGPYMAGADEFKLVLTGKGGHGAMPHTTVDPIAAGAQIVSALQTIVSRNVAPIDTAVVSITTFHGGHAFNVIPQTVEMTGTVRTFKPEVREKTLKRFEEIANGVAQAMNCAVELQFFHTAPAVTNEAKITEKVQNTARRILPEHFIDASNMITMGSEDYAFFLEKAPGMYFFVGSNNAERGLNFSHHHPKFDIDEASLPHAAALLATAAVDILSGK